MRPPARSLSLLGASIVAVTAAGCQPGEGGGGHSMARAGDVAPDVAGVTLAGDSLALSDLRGQPALVNLWATWCPPCREEMPYLESLHQRLGPRGLRTVGITVDDASARSQVVSFIDDVDVTFDILLDPRGRSMDRYRVIGLPATFLLDADGVIRLLRLGPLQERDTAFTAALEALVGS
jgi:peroxiredoxin